MIRTIALLIAVAIVATVTIDLASAGIFRTSRGDYICNGNQCVPAAAAAQPVQFIEAKKGPAPKVILPPVLKPLIQPPDFPTGVVADKLSSSPKYNHNGVEVKQKIAYEALGAEGLIDDTKKPYVSVIDPDPVRRKQVVDALKASLGDKVKVWEGPPEDWSFEPGFRKDGVPMIYAQLPDGGVVTRQADIADGIDVALGAVRKAFPAYDPAKDPDLRKPPAPAPPALPGGINIDLTNGRNQIALVIAAIVAGFALFFRGQQPAPVK